MAYRVRMRCQNGLWWWTTVYRRPKPENWHGPFLTEEAANDDCRRVMNSDGLHAPRCYNADGVECDYLGNPLPGAAKSVEDKRPDLRAISWTHWPELRPAWSLTA